MKVTFQWLRLLLFQLIPIVTFAQLTVTTPVQRMVFQRSAANEASILVAGMAPSTATTVEARFVPLAIGQGAVTAWTPMRLVAGSSAFQGKVTVSAGWYKLDVRAKAGATLLAQTYVNRVGVGEVFIIAGQSNAFGGFERVPSAVDDRVMCVDFQQDSLSEQLLPLRFSHISYGTNIGPSQPPHIYGLLGDKIAQRLNLPVLFIGAALGGTSSTEWRQSAAGNIGTTPNPAVYRRLGAALLHYIVRTGARAVLWHQGESDLYSSTQTYFDNIRYVIEKSRQQVGAKPLAWVISRASYISGQTSQQVITAQNQLINNVTNVFAGPATDSIIGYNNRQDDIHLKGEGFYRFVNAWNQSLTTAFFQNSVPFMPTDSATLITSGYTLPLTRRPGEIIAVASLRSDPHEADSKYVAQIVRTSDGATVFESAPTTDNPILITLPFTLANGQYRLRTRSTHPVITGTLGEPFNVQQDAAPSRSFPIYRQPISGGTADPAIRLFGYRYEKGATTFWGMIQATVPVEVKLESLDGSGFTDSDWHLAPPSAQAPDFEAFADFNYIRNYPARTAGVDGVVPGRYRYSVRRQGDTGAGLWFEMVLLNGRQILYHPMEPVTNVPPVLTVASSLTACLSGSFNVAVDIADNVLNTGNVFSVRLSDANGSFANETTIGTGTTSPVSVSLAPSLPTGNKYRIRVVASNPAVASAPSQPISVCPGGSDLSMNLIVDNRIPALNQPVTFTLILSNAGPAVANNVKAQSLLPAGLDFVDAVSGAVSASANTVNINAGTLLVGVNQPFVFRVKPSQSGNFATSAQITASSLFDPDSQPNSGTGDGQDDEATADFRTPNASGPVISSPNPYQTPLPLVKSNQPPANPTKADLSLRLVSSKLAPRVNDVISVTLVCNNLGGVAATNVKLQSVLPTGWQLTVTTGLTISGQTVTAPVGSIPAGSSTEMVLLVRVSGSGTLRSQILSATQADSDSTPGNGYIKGEDDEASITLRTL